ncbi:FAD-binding oxidoreductase [Haladaptatus sp. DYSN1]|uniref:FAD-binding oxidoreductase n=1 Tax=unclassified Haladaptatus TaxID=2622732 RepID=UPI002405CE98|nr:FAD-binding oxidoreductase [Haladaptatus sp. DYSN1]
MVNVESTAGGASKVDLSDEVIRFFATRFAGPLIRPGDPEYEDVRALWNGVIDKRPALIAQCTGTADVVQAVTFARQHNLPVAVRGGGHNVAGYASVDDGLVIDLSLMTGVYVDPEAQTVRAQGGATLGHIDRETQVFGLATPLGVVSETGAAGLTLNGGLGHLRRKYGLSCDNLVSAEVVTADGEVRTANVDHHEDLFWAIRGGGGNFGVVTSLEYRLHEVGPMMPTLFVWYHGDDANAVLEAYRAYTETAPIDSSTLAFTTFVPSIEEFPETTWGSPAVVLLGCFDGPQEAADEEFGPLRNISTPIADLSGRESYVDLQRLLDEDFPDGLRYYWKSVYVNELTDRIVDQVVKTGLDAPSALSTVDIWHLGGAIADRASNETAFAHRTAPYMITYEANWEDPADDDANIAWGRAGIRELRQFDVVSGAYGNFPGFDEAPAKTVFGENYERLVEVKTVYDPTNLFKLNQNIAPRIEPGDE